MTKEKLLEYFEYDKIKGRLIWKDHWDPCIVTKLKGTVAGCEKSDGYISVHVNNKSYKLHRLIWLLEKNSWPKMVDHINGNKLDNRIDNLRASTNRTNQQNRHSHRAGRLVGTTYMKRINKWQAMITINKTPKYLGVHVTEELAHKAYLKALQEIKNEQP